MAEDHQRIIAHLRQTRKYRDLCDETLLRIASWASARHPSIKEATKAAKRKLHQVYGAYAGQVDVDQIEALLASLDPSDPRPVCEQILRTHVSTSERVADLAEIYPAIWAETGLPGRVMDLACGLNPFTVPWMGPIGEYTACDIDIRLAGCTHHFLEMMPVKGRSTCNDLLVTVPICQADVVLMFKVLPCLEQQEKGAARAVLGQLTAPHVVVSFPARSLGGHERGMEVHYEGFLTDLIRGLRRVLRRLPFERETYYVLSH
ncbi:MAG: hypothetical protein O3B73_18075 [bacterium]|jgi:16S rRNA (guanine(1405)-N(7))-methyltransferase|nr:hypothetical protein [bacterium]